MTILYGSLVGTALQSTGFPAVSNRFKDGSDDILIRDTVQFTNANVIGDQVLIGVFKSSAYIDPSALVWFDAFGAGVTMNIGDVNYPSGLAAGLAISAAGNANLIKSFTAAQMGYPLWQRLGYAADPGGMITLYGTIAGANVGNAAPNFAWKIAGKNS